MYMYIKHQVIITENNSLWLKLAAVLNFVLIWTNRRLGSLTRSYQNARLMDRNFILQYSELKQREIYFYTLQAACLACAYNITTTFYDNSLVCGVNDNF